MLIAVTLLTIGSVGILQIYHYMAKKTLEIQQKKDVNLLSEEALCLLLEALHNNVIRWEDIVRNTPYSCSLEKRSCPWEARCTFEPVEDENDEVNQKIYRNVTITLCNNGKEYQTSIKSFLLCIRKQ